MVARAWAGWQGGGRECSVGTVSAADNDTVLEMNGGDGYTEMELNSMPLNCILKIVKRVHFIFYILSLLKNK